jgi:hypothetical protein
MAVIGLASNVVIVTYFDERASIATYCVNKQCMIILPNCTDCTPICCHECRNCYNEQGKRRSVCKCEQERMISLKSGDTML